MSDGLIDALRTQLGSVRDLIHSNGVVEAEEMLDAKGHESVIEYCESLEEENRKLRKRVEEVERLSTNALGVAKATDDGARTDGSPSKVDKARQTARNEIVRSILVGQTGTSKAQVTVGEVQDMCRPQLDVKYQTVKDAFGELESKWPAFTVGTDNDGTRALKARHRGLTEDLVGAVEADLGRSDLTKELISSSEGVGAE